MSVDDSIADTHRIWRPCLLFTAVIKTSVCVIISTFGNLLILFILTLVTLYSLITWIDWTYPLLVSNCTVQLLGITSLIVLNVVYGLPPERLSIFLAITISVCILSFVSFLLSLLTLISKQYRLSRDTLLPSNINGVLNEYGEHHESYRKRMQSYLETKYQMLECYEEKKRKDEELAKNIISKIGSKGSLVTEVGCDLRESETPCQPQETEIEPTNEGDTHQACSHCTDELVEKTADQSCPAAGNQNEITEHHSEESSATDSPSGTTSEHPVEGDEKNTPLPVGRTGGSSPKGEIADVASLASSPMGNNLELDKVLSTPKETVTGQNVSASTDANNSMPENHTAPEPTDKDMPHQDDGTNTITPEEDVPNALATGNTNPVDVGNPGILQPADNAHLSNVDVSPVIQLPSNCEYSKECPGMSPIVQLPTFVEEKETADFPPSHCLLDSHAKSPLNFAPEENCSQRLDRGVDFGEGWNASLVGGGRKGDGGGIVTVDEQGGTAQSADGVGDVGSKVGLDTNPFIQLPSRFESDGV